MLNRYVIKKNEKGILLKDGDYVRILPSGRYRFLNWDNRTAVQSYKIDAAMNDLALVDYLQLREPEVAAANFVIMELGENEAGLRYENGVLVEILAPASRRVFWKGLVEQRLDKIDLNGNVTLPDTLAMQLLQPALRGRAIGGLNGVLLAQVPDYWVGVLKLDGRFVRLLQPGVEAFWRFNRSVEVELVDLRIQNLEVTGQEILTRDKVSLRLNLAANWRYTDVRAAFEKLAKPADFLYRELQFGLRAAVGTRTLDELLENKQMINDVVGEQIARKLAGFGIEATSIGVKDIILPGEMKTILAQVVEAEKAAQANVIRRREETNATRSLLNTAKVMEDNPTALRLKELETLERVAERIDRISVFGGLDQVLSGLVKIGP